MAVKAQLVTQAELAAHMGVDRRQVDMWNRRRGHNGFPGVVEYVAGGPYGRKPMYDLHAVLAWHAEYTPGKGGRRKPVVK